MSPITYEAYLANPDAVKKQVAALARKERANEMHRLIINPLKRLFRRQPRLALKYA